MDNVDKQGTTGDKQWTNKGNVDSRRIVKMELWINSGQTVENVDDSEKSGDTTWTNSGQTVEMWIAKLSPF